MERLGFAPDGGAHEAHTRSQQRAVEGLDRFAGAARRSRHAGDFRFKNPRVGGLAGLQNPRIRRPERDSRRFTRQRVCANARRFVLLGDERLIAGLADRYREAVPRWAEGPHRYVPRRGVRPHGAARVRPAGSRPIAPARLGFLCGRHRTDRSWSPTPSTTARAPGGGGARAAERRSGCRQARRRVERGALGPLPRGPGRRRTERPGRRVPASRAPDHPALRDASPAHGGSRRPLHRGERGPDQRDPRVRPRAWRALRVLLRASCEGRLLDELRSQDWLPRPWRHKIEQQKRTLDRLRTELGREPSDGEIASSMGLGHGRLPADLRRRAAGDPERVHALGPRSWARTARP